MDCVSLKGGIPPHHTQPFSLSRSPPLFRNLRNRKDLQRIPTSLTTDVAGFGEGCFFFVTALCWRILGRPGQGPHLSAPRFDTHCPSAPSVWCCGLSCFAAVYCTQHRRPLPPRYTGSQKRSMCMGRANQSRVQGGRFSWREEGATCDTLSTRGRSRTVNCWGSLLPAGLRPGARAHGPRAPGARWSPASEFPPGLRPA